MHINHFDTLAKKGLYKLRNSDVPNPLIIPCNNLCEYICILCQFWQRIQRRKHGKRCVWKCFCANNFLLFVSIVHLQRLPNAKWTFIQSFLFGIVVFRLEWILGIITDSGKIQDQTPKPSATLPLDQTPMKMGVTSIAWIKMK